MKVLIISGKAQNGKDTVAAFIRDKLVEDKHSVLVTHYADLLKFICRNYFGWNGVKDEHGRKMLQYVGTEVIRKENPDLWVNFIVLMLKYFHNNWDYVIIPDGRFPNEISVMRDSGFETLHLRVTRSNFISPLTAGQRNHQSETALDTYEADYCIDNNGTLSELKLKVNNWIKENLYGRES